MAGHWPAPGRRTSHGSAALVRSGGHVVPRKTPDPADMHSIEVAHRLRWHIECTPRGRFATRTGEE